MKKTVHIHLEELERLSGGKTDFIIRMLETALSNTPALLERMKAELDSKKGDGINATAHRLRPAFYYLGRTDICSLLEEIEESASGMNPAELHQKAEIIFRESELILAELKNTLAELKT